MTKKSAKKRKKQNAVSSFGQDPFIEEIEKNVQPEDPNIIYKQDLIVSRDEIGGLENVLKEIDKIARYAKFEKLYTLFGIRKNPHILLHGPPGTGKTYVAKYAAKKIDAAYMELNLTEHLSMWHGMTERGVIGQLETYEEVCKEHFMKGIVFMDEAESIFGHRGTGGTIHAYDNIAQYFLRFMDGTNQTEDLILIAATNKVEMIDEAFLRSGRFNSIEVGIPDRKGLYDIWEGQVRATERKSELEKVFKYVPYDDLADESYRRGFVGADVRSIIDKTIEDYIDNLVSNVEDSDELVTNVTIPGDLLLETLIAYKKFGQKKRVGFK